MVFFFFFQAEDGIRDRSPSRGLGDVYKRQVKIGILPLSKKLSDGAMKVYEELAKEYNCEFDERGNIGKRYRRQDEIGTPYCVTFDFDSLEDGAVTVRDRDTMEQERVKIEDLKAYFAEKFAY